MTAPAKEKIIVALDAPNAVSALRLADELTGVVSWVKVGLQLFIAEGPSVIRALKERDFRIFLDLKIHDIPNTAKEAIRSAAALGVEMATIHLAGGRAMIREAVAASGDTLVLGVTVLTSFDHNELRGIGVTATPAEQVSHLVNLGTSVGLRGVVCSPHEIASLREQHGDALTIVTPGVRPAGADLGDQQRVMTPSEAIKAGANYLVIGRPITGAPSKRDAALRIVESI